MLNSVELGGGGAADGGIYSWIVHIGLVDVLFIEINVPQEKNVIIGVIYRAPNQNLPNFLAKYQKLIEKISHENKICYIIGDFNLNLLHHQSHGSTGEFLDIKTC